MEALKLKVLTELLGIGQTEEEANALIAKHFNNALYLKSARKMAHYMVA
jgi:hypothetical protein